MELALTGCAHEERVDDRVEVFAHGHAHDAHALRLAGGDWESIAAETGYVSGRVACLAVTAWLEKIAVELAPEHRRQALHLELDRLQVPYWEKALRGDDRAAEVVLKVIARRCKIMGFDKPADSLAPGRRTVVVGGTSEQYVATLRALVDGTA
jgi:hypothetical protein